MSDGRVHLSVEKRVATITFDRPAAYNAVTFGMYRQLSDACRGLLGLRDLLAIVVRGAGKAFVAGTDIGEFKAFAAAEDGLRYEAEVEKVLAQVESLPAPTIAVIDGAAMGGGLLLATACDFRILSHRARLGVPIARTVGNCLSSRNVGRLEREFGLAATRRMLLLAETLGAEEALRLGYALDCVESSDLEARLEKVLATLSAHAPLTMAATRRSLGRIGRGSYADEDILDFVYGSNDFHEGVDAFLAKRKPEWTAPLPLDPEMASR